MSNRIVIVGGGLAAARIVRAYRDAGGDAPLTMLSADTTPPYNRPPLSKGFLRGEIEADAVFVEPEAAYAELGVDLRLGMRRGRRRYTTTERVTLADGDARRLRPARARERVAPRARSASPARSSRASTPTARSTMRRPCATPPASASAALVIGGGFIGMETAASLRRGASR